jgi:flagellin
MANIGATTAFYKVETSLSRANNEVSKSMERLATGRQNANAGDRSSYVAMSDTFKLDYVGTKAGIKSVSVVMGYLETGLRVIDSASALLSRIQELAVLGANDTNTVEDNKAINAEANALGKEFDRLLSNAKYKGAALFGTSNAMEVSLGGRGAKMSFGIGAIAYKTSETTASYLWNGTAATLATQVAGDSNTGPTNTDDVTKIIQKVQELLNSARVEAGSQYAAMESALSYTTDLTAQYELGFNTVNDVNFSMETAHLAKNQILQQAATAMLAQANQGQQGLLQLIS